MRSNHATQLFSAIVTRWSSDANSRGNEGVLNDALRAFAIQGGGDLKAMTAPLADFPQGFSEIGNADKLAVRMADELKTAVVTDPLLKATPEAAVARARRSAAAM